MKCKFCNEQDNFGKSLCKIPFDLGLLGGGSLSVRVNPQHNGLTVAINQDGLDPFFEERIVIYYCPMCGRQLRKMREG